MLLNNSKSTIILKVGVFPGLQFPVVQVFLRIK